MKISAIFWSDTDNTEEMANAIAEGAREADAEVSLLTCTEFGADHIAAYN